MANTGDEFGFGGMPSAPRPATGPEQWIGAADPLESFGTTIEQALQRLTIELAGLRAERDGLRLELEGIRTQLQLTQQQLADRDRFASTVRELGQIVQQLSVPSRWPGDPAAAAAAQAAAANPYVPPPPANPYAPPPAANPYAPPAAPLYPPPTYQSPYAPPVPEPSVYAAPPSPPEARGPATFLPPAAPATPAPEPAPVAYVPPTPEPAAPVPPAPEPGAYVPPAPAPAPEPIAPPPAPEPIAPEPVAYVPPAPTPEPEPVAPPPAPEPVAYVPPAPEPEPAPPTPEPQAFVPEPEPYVPPTPESSGSYAFASAGPTSTKAPVVAATEESFFSGPGVWIGEPPKADERRNALKTWATRIGSGLAGLIVAMVFIVSIGPKFLPYQMFFVRSGSMHPTFDTGDMVVLTKVDASDLKKGDIITFDRPDKPGTLVTHRIVGIQTNEQGRSFQTKGDFNDTADPWSVPATGTGWKYKMHIPKLGFAFGYLGTPQARLALLAIPALLLGILSIVDIWKPQQPQARRRR